MARNHGTAGRNAREMAKRRYIKLAVYASILFLIAIIWFFNFNKITKLGLPAILVLSFVVIQGADHIEKKGLWTKKRAKDADRGAHAEEVVADKLKDLPDSYHAFHDITFDGFNLDHVIVGPGGIFVVETKSHSGEVDSKGDTLLLNGKPPPKNFLNQAWSQTYQLRDFIYSKTSRKWEVIPVLCFTRAYVKVRQPVKGIEVVSGKYLVPHFSKQKQTLSLAEIEVVTRVLQDKC